MLAIRRLLILVVAVAATGCLNSTTLVRVKPDGSGTVEQSMLVNQAAIKGLMSGMGGGQAKTSAGMFTEEDFKRGAERMGVRFVSSTPVKQGNLEGAKATYAFDDISKLRVDQDPQVGAAAGSMARAATGTPIRFGFSRQGNTSVLTIAVDEKAAAAATERAQQAPPLEQVDPAVMQMVKTMFDGFRVSIDLEVDGTITKTNADYVNGSRVTLLELEAAGIFQDESKLRALQSKVRPGVSLTELRPFLKDIKGVKMNHPSISIAYRQ